MTDIERNAEIVRRFEAGETASGIVMTMSEPRMVMERIDLVNDTLRAELKRRADELQEAQDLVMALFHHAYDTILHSGKHGYDNCSESTGEWAQRYLVRIGRVRPEECVKP